MIIRLKFNYLSHIQPFSTEKVGKFQTKNSKNRLFTQSGSFLITGFQALSVDARNHIVNKSRAAYQHKTRMSTGKVTLFHQGMPYAISITGVSIQ